LPLPFALVPRSRSSYPHKAAAMALQEVEEYFLKFVLWCGDIENCCKIDHIFSAT
jgi:hypothetical protein